LAERFGVPVAEGDVGFAEVAEALGARPAAGEIGVAGVGEGGAHELVGPAGPLGVAEESDIRGVLDRGGFGGGGDRFVLSVADETGVKVVAGVGVGEPVSRAGEGGALLDGVEMGGLPEDAGDDLGGLRGRFDRRDVPAIGDRLRGVAAVPVGGGVWGRRLRC